MATVDTGRDAGEPGLAGTHWSRRAFLLAACGAVGAVGIGTDAFTGALGRIQVTRADLAVPGLPRDLEGLSIAHLTDVHLYDGLHRGARRAIELIQDIRPDITFVTGDIVESTDQLPVAATCIRECRGRLATAVILGNWEHAVGATPEDMTRTCDTAGAVFLLNQAHLVGRGSAMIALVGLDDPRAGRADPEGAIRDVPSGAIQVWAFHSPGFADRLRRRPLPPPALILAGHTHGGQIRLPPLPAITPPGSGRFVAGWYRDTFAPLFVSRGIGTSDIRARFLCPPELGVLTLRAA